MGKRFHVSDLSGVPDVGYVEHTCRQAGAIPKVNRATTWRQRDAKANRARALRRIARLFHGDMSDADVRIIARYIEGEFDRRPEQGRPADFERWYRVYKMAERAESVRRERHCSRAKAVTRVLKEAGIDDPDDATHSRVLNYAKR